MNAEASTHVVSPTRVLHVAHGRMYGGVESLLATLAREQHVVQSLESHFALCFEGRAATELRDLQAPVEILGATRISRPLTVRKSRLRLRQLLAEKAFDVVLCHAPWAQAIFGPVARDLGIPVVFWQHGVATGLHWLERWAKRCSPSLAICTSHFCAQSLDRLYPGVAREVVYCPISRPPASDGHARVQVRRDLDTPAGATVIVQVSRLEAWKGHLPHLAALQLLREEPNWICWIVGGAQRPSEQEYERQLRQKVLEFELGERVRFLGQRSDVWKLLHAADIFCQPNTEPEPFGIVFVEALYAGLAVVSTAIGGAKEIIGSDCGLLVHRADPVQLAAALRDVIRDPAMRERLGGRGKLRADELCNAERRLTQLSDCLSRVAA